MLDPVIHLSSSVGNNASIQSWRPSHKTNVSRKIIDTLKSKNVVYTKADKGNSVVILDNEDYKQKLEDLLEQGQYLKIKKKPII